MRKPLVAGNWKMNGTRMSLTELGEMGKAYGTALRAKVDMLICPPATLLYPASAVVIGTGVAGVRRHKQPLVIVVIVQHARIERLRYQRTAKHGACGPKRRQTR